LRERKCDISRFHSCRALQRTARHCNNCNTLQHTATTITTRCLSRAATHCNTVQHKVVNLSVCAIAVSYVCVLQCVAVCCSPSKDAMNHHSKTRARHAVRGSHELVCCKCVAVRYSLLQLVAVPLQRTVLCCRRFSRTRVAKKASNTSEKASLSSTENKSPNAHCAACVCVGCQQVSYIRMHSILCIFSHPITP